MIFIRIHNSTRLPFLIICLFILINFPLSAKEKQVELKWKAVPRASGYLVEIKNENDKIVIQKKTANPFLDFNLSEGDYQARISVLNKFQKVSVSSKWFAIKIRLSLKPVFISVSRQEFMIGPDPAEAVIIGDDFQKLCRVSFQKDSQTVEAESTVFNSEQSLSIKINTSRFQPGYYDIIITNPGGNSIAAERKIQFTAMEAAPAAAVPEFKGVAPGEIIRADSEQVLEITGDNFEEGCDVSLFQGDTSHEPLKTERVSKNKILITINPSGLNEGRYGIIISNKGKSFVKTENALNLIQPVVPVVPLVLPKIPSISSVTPLSIPRENINIDIKIKGSNILQGSRISFLSGETVVLTGELKVTSDTKADFKINPSELKDGDYTLKITTPENESSTYKKSLEIYTRRVPTGIYIGISPLLNYNYVLFDWGKSVDNSFRGFNFYAGFDLPVFNNVRVIKDCGIEFIFDAVQYSGKKPDEDQVESELVTLITASGIYYKNNFSLPVDFLFRIGTGLTVSKLETRDTASHTRTVYKSFDPVFYAGPSVRYTFSDYFFAEIGADYQFIYYTDTPLNTIHSFLRFGVIF